jgi:hypothetical protein
MKGFLFYFFVFKPENEVKEGEIANLRAKQLIR